MRHGGRHQDGRAYARVEPRDLAVELVLIERLEAHPDLALDLRVVRAVLASRNVVVRFVIRLTSTVSPWYAKATAVLREPPAPASPASAGCAVMRRLTASAVRRCMVSRDERERFDAWARSLGEEPSFECRSLVVKEFVR